MNLQIVALIVALLFLVDWSYYLFLLANIIGGIAGAAYAAVTGGSVAEVALAGVAGFLTGGRSLALQFAVELIMSTESTDPNADKVPSPPIPSCDPLMQSCEPQLEEPQPEEPQAEESLQCGR